MSKLPLTIAVSRYDHVNDVLTAAVPVEGIDLNPLDLPLHDIFFRFIHFKDFDVAELSMAKYVSMISQGDDSLIALPVFPSRVPRHSAIYVRRDGPVKQPADLRSNGARPARINRGGTRRSR
jgi:4,5-dihydroxyphthalate decarboxylase